MSQVGGPVKVNSPLRAALGNLSQALNKEETKPKEEEVKKPVAKKRKQSSTTKTKRPSSAVRLPWS